MNFLTSIARAFVPSREDLRYRIGPLDGDFPSMEQQLAAIRRQFDSPRAYRPASVREALGVPAILDAVSLIANTVGTLAIEAFRNSARLPVEEIPRVLIRPNPYTTPGEFYRDLAYYQATRGEAWMWVASRDLDDVADALYPVPPWEVRVEPNERNRLFPSIYWNDRLMPSRDMRHITYLPEGLRGVGPLQLAGAAVSVTVEADQWAANFFSGSLPSIVGQTDMDLDEDDLIALDKQWLEKPNNMPRWLGGGIKLGEPPYNAQKAQLTESRQHQVGEVARMFSMPGALLEYNMPGSSLHYQNDTMIWTDFQRRCLSPHYLEPIEQALSDLLTRSTVARFNLDQLLRADPKTRAEYYDKVVPLGFPSEEMLRREGVTAGNVDVAPVPPTPSSAIPPVLAYQRTAIPEGRCPKCRKRLAEAAPPGWRTTCPRCGTVAVA